MKITFDNDEDANEFFRVTIRGMYGASGALHGTPMGQAVDAAADKFCAAYFEHFAEDLAAGRKAARAAAAPAPPVPPAAPAAPAPLTKRKQRPTAPLLET